MHSHLPRFLLSLIFVFPLLALAHGDESHDDAGVAGTGAGEHTAPDGSTGQAIGTPELSVSVVVDDLSWSGFPTLHPMVVHVPVIMIPVALLFSVFSLFSLRRAPVWLAFGFAAAGLAGGLVAAFPTHPHTTGLSEAAKFTLRKHDFFAYGTLWLTFAALLIAVICIWKPTRLARSGLSAILLFATLSVAITGHYGGTLAYVHGIGSQGRFLSAH